MPAPTAPYLRPDGSVDPAYFEALYAAEADPWGFDTSPYEAAKYAATLAALPRARYARAFEAGCANGALTERLADRCDALWAVDVAPDALDRARERLAGVPHVRVERRAMPDEMPAGPFDLAVVSEVGYYLARERLADWADRLADAVEPGGHLVLVHWTGPTDYPLTGDDVHDLFLARPGWTRLASDRQPEYRLDVLEREGERVESRG
ncbi:class I SAM-dependent DNA methyltransferase [Rubrivirga sp.]|uniref:class I SAM-dependent DNA methyltransferase n=1 Tax=Rubrivirga sp. TaxID=1885344 RepID=UPI003B51D218